MVASRTVSCTEPLELVPCQYSFVVFWKGSGFSEMTPFFHCWKPMLETNAKRWIVCNSNNIALFGKYFQVLCSQFWSWACMFNLKNGENISLCSISSKRKINEKWMKWTEMKWKWLLVFQSDSIWFVVCEFPLIVSAYCLEPVWEISKILKEIWLGYDRYVWASECQEHTINVSFCPGGEGGVRRRRGGGWGGGCLVPFTPLHSILW